MAACRINYRRVPWGNSFENSHFTHSFTPSPSSSRGRHLNRAIPAHHFIRLCLWALQPVNRKPWAQRPHRALGRSWDRSHRVETTTARRRTHGLSSLRGSSQSKQAATICTIMFTDNHLQTSFALAPLHSLSQGLPQARIISTLQGSSPKPQELSTL